MVCIDKVKETWQSGRLRNFAKVVGLNGSPGFESLRFRKIFLTFAFSFSLPHNYEMTSEKITMNAGLQKVVDEGIKIYEKIKGKYEQAYTGKFLAIDIDSHDVYMSDTSADAVMAARKEHPTKIFYVVKIGYDAVETLASVFSARSKLI